MTRKSAFLTFKNRKYHMQAFVFVLNSEIKIFLISIKLFLTNV